MSNQCESESQYIVFFESNSALTIKKLSKVLILIVESLMIPTLVPVSHWFASGFGEIDLSDRALKSGI